MSTQGAYCKAYPISQFRAFPGWKEPDERNLGDEEILFLQENYVVTDNIFLDEGVVFDEITPEWETFCTETLGFQQPVSDVI
jgi:hypothetical protein